MAEKDRELCSEGARLNEGVVQVTWDRAFADRVWDRMVFRLGFCEDEGVSETGGRFLESMPGQSRLVAEKYCADTWRDRGRGVDLVAVRDLTPWFRQEVFCEIVTNFVDPVGALPLPSDDFVSGE